MKICLKERNIWSVYRLSFPKGKVATKIITILLSAFAFVLFAIGSMGFTYSYTDFVTRAYLHYSKDFPYILFETDGTSNMSIAVVNKIEEETGLSFVYHTAAGIDWNYFVNDKSPSSLEEGDLYDAWMVDDLAGRMALAGSVSDYEAMGYTLELEAGKYPTEKNEVAISEAHFRSFQKRGYCNAAKSFVWQSFGEDGMYLYDASRDIDEVDEIKTYSDIIGKTLGAGDIETEEQAYEYVIVGVVNTNYDAVLAEETGYREYPAARLMFSEEWKTSSEEVYQMFGGEINDYKTMKKCVKIVLRLKQEAEQNGVNYPVLYHMDPLFRSSGMTDQNIIGLILGGAGIFFGIFAALLNGHLTTVSIEQKQKKIGILRAMGANKKTVTKIFLVEALLTATGIFVLALGVSLGIYFGWIRAWTSLENFGVSMLVYNGWTVLILAVLCYAVPLLCTVAPIKKFFKRPIIDNITGNLQYNQKRRSGRKD